MYKNIILVMCDQQRLSTLSCYGETPCQTPYLDAIANNAVIFDNAYTSCPLCTPARATVMTGLFPHQHGMNGNSHNTGCAVHNLLDKPSLLSRRLQSGNKACSYTGKWHLGAPNDRIYQDQQQASLPRDVGFSGQQFPGHGGGGFNYPEYRTYLAENGFQHQLRGNHKLGKGFVPNFGILDEPEAATVPYFLTEHSIQCIDQHIANDEAFFLWHNFWGPHEPYYVPQAYYDLYKDVDIPEWPNYRWDSEGNEGPHRIKINPSHHELQWSDWAEAIRHYYAFMTLIDKQIGRLVQHLEQRGILEETLIIFTADHGETLGSHGGLMDKGLNHFEEIQRIPLLMRLPKARDGGKRIDELVSLVDLFPTFLDAAQVDMSDLELPGRSLLRLIDGCHDWRDDLIIQSEGVENVNISLRSLRWKHYKYGFTVGMCEQLYDLNNDPHEMSNVAKDPRYNEVLDEMRHRLVNWMRDHNDRLVRNGIIQTLLRLGWEERVTC